MTPRPVSVISLSVALYGFVMLGALLFGFASTYLLFDRIEKVQSAALEAAVTVRGRHAAHDFATAVEQDWRRLKEIADRAALMDSAELKLALDLAVGSGERITWAGFATPDGIVQQASNDFLKDVDVSARPWFHRGLGGDFAGDVHDAVLLNKLLGGTAEDPLRFIDLAAQVHRPDGQVAGVLAFQIDFAWAESFLEKTASSLGLELYLVNQNGEVIVATDGCRNAPHYPATLPSFPVTLTRAVPNCRGGSSPGTRLTHNLTHT